MDFGNWINWKLKEKILESEKEDSFMLDLGI